MMINYVIKMVTLMIKSGPEDCVLELVPLKTASSNVNARHYKVPLAEIGKVLKFIVFFYNILGIYIKVQFTKRVLVKPSIHTSNGQLRRSTTNEE